MTDVVTDVRTDRATLLKLDRVEYSYPTGTKALGGLSLDVHPGEVIAIVGPSGCGKSTLLGLITDLRRPSAGSVTWRPASERGGAADAAWSRRYSMVFQKDTVLPWRTVEKNASFGLENLKVPRAERKERVDALLAVAGLEGFRKTYPKNLSGGMRRRLALVMAMAVRPELLLLDEPFSSVDEPTRIGLHADVLHAVYRDNTAVVLVTHDLSEAITLADTVYILSERPAVVASRHEIPFGHDRDVYEVRATDEYNEIYQHLWSLMWAPKKQSRSPVQ